MRDILRTVASAVLAVVLALLLTGAGFLTRPATAAVAWGPQRTVADWSWSTGSSLAVTGSGSSLVVHELLSSDFVDGQFATDHGPYEGVFLASSRDRGQSWSGPVRVSQAGKHADRGALAGDGQRLYAVWVSRASYDNYSPSGRRVLYFRANDAAGSGGGWGPTVRLSKTKGRVDQASVAAGGGRVYVVWTDSVSGDVRLALSPDGGKTWKRSVLGKAKASDPTGEGRVGLPSVAAAGPNVGVSWLATSNGIVKARLSTNGGRAWHPPITLASSGGAANEGSPSVAGVGDRLAFAWTTPSGVWVKTWSGGSWSAVRQVTAFGGSSIYSGGYDVAVSLTGTDAVGVAWSACRSARCATTSALTRTNLLWSQSLDGGVTWSGASLVHGANVAGQQINDGASIAWLDPSTRLLTYSGSVSGLTTYRLYSRVGSGTP
jgi:hypothetical protein